LWLVERVFWRCWSASPPILEYFDPPMRPIADADTVNERGDLILRRHRS